MNAPFSVSIPIFFDRDDALSWAKEWRSDCLDAFSIAERTTGQLLNFFAARRSAFGKVTLNAPTRPSFTELRAKLETKGHCRRKRRDFNATLDKLDAHLAWRNHVGHGELDVRLDRNGKWLVTLCHPEGSCTGTLRSFMFPVADAAAKLANLRKEVELYNLRAGEILSAVEQQVKVQSADSGRS